MAAVHAPRWHAAARERPQRACGVETHPGMPCLSSELVLLIFETPMASNAVIAIACASGEVRSNALEPVVPAKLAWVIDEFATLESRKTVPVLRIVACSATNPR